jgi:uncharacterized membrane protein YfhO
MDGTAETYRDRLMLHGIYLEDQYIKKYGYLLTEYTREDIPNLTESVYLEDCTLRAENACDSFTFDSNSFTATITLDADNLVFFSVPYNEGWTAYVNGKAREVIPANVGFMAVKADAGENEIVFRYETPGCKIGGIISGTALILLCGWCLPYYRKRKLTAKGSSERKRSNKL